MVLSPMSPMNWNDMTNKILVAYATRAGSTAEIADFVGKTMSKHGATVDVKPMKSVTNLTGYAAVVLGSGIRAGQPYPEIKNLVKQYKNELKTMPVALFVVCMTLKNDTPENRKIVDAYLNPLRRKIKPVDVGLFAGKMDYSKLGFFARFISKSIVKVPEGDFRNWNVIESWATALLSKLKGKPNQP